MKKIGQILKKIGHKFGQLLQKLGQSLPQIGAQIRGQIRAEVEKIRATRYQNWGKPVINCAN